MGRGHRAWSRRGGPGHVQAVRPTPPGGPDLPEKAGLRARRFSSRMLDSRRGAPSASGRAHGTQRECNGRRPADRPDDAGAPFGSLRIWAARFGFEVWKIPSDLPGAPSVETYA